MNTINYECLGPHPPQEVYTVTASFKLVTQILSSQAGRRAKREVTCLHAGLKIALVIPIQVRRSAATSKASQIHGTPSPNQPSSEQGQETCRTFFSGPMPNHGPSGIEDGMHSTSPKLFNLLCRPQLQCLSP
jgi:hypothetical protein